MADPKTTDLYYYDERRKVTLHLDTTQCVVNQSKIKPHVDEQRLAVICAEPYKLVYGLYLIPRSILATDELARLEELKLVEPIFMAAGGHIVITPEILCSKRISDAIFSRANGLGISPCKRAGHRKLAVESEHVLDVLAIANRLTELFPAASFSPCFFRLMKNPCP